MKQLKEYQILLRCLIYLINPCKFLSHELKAIPMNSLDATLRKTETKGQLNNLRKDGNVPAILYGGKDENQKIFLSTKQVKNLIEKENFASDVILLKIDGKEYNVLPREITFDTVSDEPIHIDFLRIVSGSKINLEIPVKFINQEKKVQV